MTFVAEYEGRCGLCDEIIREGEKAGYYLDEVCHVHCIESEENA